MSGVDPVGTCHLVGCPDKGQHPPHPIGCPDTFAPYEQPSTLTQALVAVDVEDLALLLDTYAAQLWHLNKAAGSVAEEEAFLRLQRALATARNGGPR